jgi:hypothetical protein
LIIARYEVRILTVYNCPCIYALMKGFLCLSSPMVVAGPCPVKAITSSGSANNLASIDLISFLILPPGKSVLPIEPANKVSPTKTTLASSK